MKTHALVGYGKHVVTCTLKDDGKYYVFINDWFGVKGVIEEQAGEYFMLCQDGQIVLGCAPTLEEALERYLPK